MFIAEDIKVRWVACMGCQPPKVMFSVQLPGQSWMKMDIAPIAWAQQQFKEQASIDQFNQYVADAWDCFHKEVNLRNRKLPPHAQPARK